MQKIHAAPALGNLSRNPRNPDRPWPDPVRELIAKRATALDPARCPILAAHWPARTIAEVDREIVAAKIRVIQDQGG